jgi:hypothetical protein
MAAERLRRILLKQMGITSWFPRAPLPGAALSHEQCLQDFLDEADTGQRPDVASVAADAGNIRPLLAEGVAAGAGLHQSPLPVHTASVSPTVVQLAELLAKKPTGTASPVIEKTSAPDISGSPTGPEIVVDSQGDDIEAFGFSWFNVDKRLAVLAMLPAGDSRLATTCRQMLARLLAALHTPWQALDLVDQNFHWPFADDLGLPADASAARQAVDGFIARRLREQNCAVLLVLSDNLPWFLDQHGVNENGIDVSNAAEPTKLRFHRQFGFTMLATYSLHAMEKDAGLKREAWQSLQVLRERLNR